MGYTLKNIKITDNLDVELRFMIMDQPTPYSIAVWYKGVVKKEIMINASTDEEAIEAFNKYLEEKMQ